MSKFKVGDKVRVNQSAVSSFYKEGAEGEIVYKDCRDTRVKFFSGDYNRSCDGVWWVDNDCIDLITDIKESNMKKSEGWGLGRKEGESSTITAWGVEVDGKLHPDMVSKSRSNARGNRNYFASYGAKAVVRKIQIKVLEGKI